MYLERLLRLRIASQYVEMKSDFSFNIHGEELFCKVENNTIEVYGPRVVSHDELLYKLLQKLYVFKWNKYYKKRRKKNTKQGLLYMEYLASMGEVVFRTGNVRIGGERLNYLILYSPSKTLIQPNQLEDLKQYYFEKFDFIELKTINEKGKEEIFLNDIEKINNYLDHYLGLLENDQEKHLQFIKNKL